MNKLIAVIYIFVLSSCSSVERDYIDYGETLYASHKSSIYEILGNIDWYNKQPVSIRAVASFEFGYDGVSGIYATTEDYENWSYGWLVLDLNNIPKDYYPSLTALNGKFVTIHGIFHSYERKKLPLPSENEGLITICKGICGAAGYIEVIRVIE